MSAASDASAASGDGASADGSDISDDNDNEVEALRDAIDLVASAHSRTFSQAIGHLCGIVSRRISHSVTREMKDLQIAAAHLRADDDGEHYTEAEFLQYYGAEEGALKWMETAPADVSQQLQSASLSVPTTSCSRLDALPPELRACVATATSICSSTRPSICSLFELPAEYREQIVEALWSDSHGDMRAIGRAVCVARTAFRSASLLQRLHAARDRWLRRWLCVEGLPRCPLPEQGRRVHRSLRPMLTDTLNARVVEEYPGLCSEAALTRFCREHDLPTKLSTFAQTYLFCLAAGEKASAWMVSARGVSTGAVFLDCGVEPLARMLLDLTGSAMEAHDGHYILGVQEDARAFCLRKMRDPPPQPLARHKLKLRLANESDLATLTDRSLHTVRVSAGGLQERCEDYFDGETYSGIWAPPERVMKQRVSHGESSRQVQAQLQGHSE